MHKKSICARFIVDSRNCCTKPRSDVISKVFKMETKYVQHKKNFETKYVQQLMSKGSLRAFKFHGISKFILQLLHKK